MAQYQSFPGAPGDSLTLDKLKRLSLPELEGKAFLDVGCNEGFFCGFAKHLGAARSVGVDHARGFIERARRRFPGCEFHAHGWDALPAGPFDVILLASALHYADDQEALLHKLVQHLSQDGVLVVELGIVTSKNSEWVKVERGSDERLFPTMPKLREILAPYAWKWMGPSVAQSGDPVARHVLHVSRRRRAAYLLMQPPAYGKSSIARSLFPKASIPVISGDVVIGRIAAGKQEAPEELAEAIKDDYSPFRIDLAIERIFDRGLAPALVALWIAQAGTDDFGLDMYVPSAHQATVRTLLIDAGYLPVTLDWQRPGANLMAERRLAEAAEAFYLSMADEPSMADRAQPSVDSSGGALGFVDEVTVRGGRLVLRGWATDRRGAMPASLSIRVGSKIHFVGEFEKQLRPDVQRHLGLAHALVGYSLSVPAQGLRNLKALEGVFEVRATDGDAFTLASGVVAQIGSGDG